MKGRSERIVRTGSMRRERQAMTYHERLHADGNMRVHWYHHMSCATPAGELSNARTAKEAK